ncbi:PREDICTED: molybdopterin synthase catalytic subunit 2, partial [Papilio polytes]|uniref:molybdopterin synthase catalytic subunit 2 n=1 Tax=Papilio polytes TaxID=76194 RepID=UPI000676654D
MDHLKLTEDKLSVEAISELVGDSSCGAISVFIGTTRDNFEGKKVVKLEYEAYEAMALKAFKDICNELRGRWPAVHGIAIYHRLGAVACGEASLVVAVSSAHRGPALAAAAHCLERLKASAPVWKREHYAGDLAPHWKENPECSPTLPPHRSPSPSPPRSPDNTTDTNLIQINVSNEELQQRIQNFIERKRAQVDLSNIVDFIPGCGESDAQAQDADTCARVRTQFVKRSDSKGHLKIRRVHNEWGPQVSC